MIQTHTHGRTGAHCLAWHGHHASCLKIWRRRRISELFNFILFLFLTTGSDSILHLFFSFLSFCRKFYYQFKAAHQALPLLFVAIALALITAQLLLSAWGRREKKAIPRGQAGFRIKGEWKSYHRWSLVASKFSVFNIPPTLEHESEDACQFLFVHLLPKEWISNSWQEYHRYKINRWFSPDPLPPHMKKCM